MLVRLGVTDFALAGLIELRCGTVLVRLGVTDFALAGLTDFGFSGFDGVEDGVPLVAIGLAGCSWVPGFVPVEMPVAGVPTCGTTAGTSGSSENHAESTSSVVGTSEEARLGAVPGRDDSGSRGESDGLEDAGIVGLDRCVIAESLRHLTLKGAEPATCDRVTRNHARSTLPSLRSDSLVVLSCCLLDRCLTRLDTPPALE